MASVKVAVRVRPLNQREKNMNAKCIIEMEQKRTSILNLKTSSYAADQLEEHGLHGRERIKDFFFDYSYWSCDSSSSNFASQEMVYMDLGTDVVTAADEGYNACIFAYGQTGSGKTHTMMGQEGNEGLIPRICKNLFRQIRNKEDEGVSFRIEVSYLEIYNEKVRDLLRPVDAKSGSAHTLKVREHPKEGPYVQGLTRHLVTDYEAIEAIMKQGNDQRTTAATNMNDTSSRSHAIFTLSYNQAKFLHDMPSETVSKLNLVDLAGSERADATGATGIRLKEGGNINKSLVTLGSVISQLAEASTTPHKKNLFIPYRDSVLTWLLKDSLGGNSKTIMIAAISPADCNYAETLSTLRYANRAKNIVNKPTVNEDVNVKLIRDLRAEVEKLKSMLGQDALSDAEKAAARRLHENEERLGLLTDKWKDRWREMQKIMQERELAFQHRRDAGIRMESELPHLVALEDDLLSTGILLYHLKQGKTFVGTENSKTKPDIVISGAHVLDEHCVIENQDGFVVLSPFQDALCSVNGATVRKKTKLQQGDVVIIGKTNLFRFNHPAEAQELREKRKSFGPGFGDLVMSTKFRSETDLLAKLRSPDSHVKNREEDLTKQLEEARSELERQKQDEERRLEEARNEFTKLIREESKRLQETRKELERQQRARLNEAQSPEQIRKHLQELERHHQEEEERRAQREKELVDDIKAKEDLLSTQKKKLSTYEKQCEDIKTNTDQSIDREVAVFFEKRTQETTRLSQELRTIVDVERSKGGSSEVLMKEMKQVWVEAGDKIAEEERLLRDLSREYNLKVAQFEGDRNISDEQKAAILLERDDLQRRILNSQSSLEELAHSKAKVLKRFQQDYKNRYEILQWEKDRALQKYERKRDSMLRKKSLKQQPLIEEQTKLDEIKERYFNASREQTEKVALERAKLDVRKKEAMERTLENQREFNDRVQKYQALLRRGQESIAEKKRETEVLRNDLEDLVKHYKRGSSTEVKFKIDAMRVELNDKVENVHELERNHGVVKAEEEKVIQSMLKELNQKKALNEKDAQTSEKLLKELERVSREQLLQLHEEVDEQEKVVLQCKSNIERYEEKFKQVDKLYEAEVTKHDTELLYVAYLLEKDFESQQRDSELSSIKSCKANLEQINSAYRENIESVQSKMEELWKPLIESREQAQVVLEDVVRAIGIREVTLSELQEQFALERKEELEHIESLREKLADFEEEHDLSGRCSADEILHVHSEDDQSFDDILKREKQKIQDEMYDKILLLEQMMQSEISALKKREESTIACLQRDRENLLRSMEKVEKEKQSHQERLVELQSLVEFKDQELKETRELAQKEIDDLHHRLTDAGKEIMDLQERLDKYVSVTSLALANHMPDELSDKEVADLLLRVNESSGVEDEDRQVASHRISPPPTPVHRFLQSVNLYKKNQVVVSIPRFILRGLGRSSYHVFEVKLKVGDDTWSVFRRYRRFRELHKQMELEYPIVANLEFPSKRYFGNRVDAFVRVRRAQLEAYLNALLSIMSNVSHCPIYAVVDRHLTKRDVASLNPFFQQGVYEQSSR